MGSVHVEFDDNDVVNILKGIIKHPNADEIVKLLVPFMRSSTDATKWFIKLTMGSKLPDIIPVGTICLTHVNNLGYDVDKQSTIESGLSDENGMIVCTIKEFKGFHHWTHYEVQHQAIDKNGKRQELTSYLMTQQLEILEEF